MIIPINTFFETGRIPTGPGEAQNDTRLVACLPGRLRTGRFLSSGSDWYNKTMPSASPLAPHQVEQFHRDGYLGPLQGCTAEEMESCRAHVAQLLMVDGIVGHGPHHNRHLDDATMYRLATLPPIVAAMRSVLGPDLILWRTNVFEKPPGGKEIPWHQDRNYWPLEPAVVISAWLAIDEATTENACLQILPGSHRHVLPNIPAEPDMEFTEMADLRGVSMDGKVDMELLPGQFVLFNESTLHHSEANRSDRDRRGLAIRVIIPQVRVLSPDSDAHAMMVISGRDFMGFNRLIPPPV